MPDEMDVDDEPRMAFRVTQDDLEDEERLATGSAFANGTQNADFDDNFRPSFSAA